MGETIRINHRLGGIVAKGGRGMGAYNYDLTFIARSGFSVGFKSTSSNVYTTPSAGGSLQNQWYYVVGVYDGDALRLYINGVLEEINENAIGDVATDYNPPVFIGDHNNPYTTPFKGIIDEVRILNRALSEVEIKENYVISLLNALIEDTSSLPNESFKKETQDRRSSLIEKIEAVIEAVMQKHYKPAINKLERDIKDKIEKWINDPWKTSLINDIDRIISVLEQLTAS